MTIRQVLARQWQIPLFLLSLVVFALVILQTRPPAPAPPSFDELYIQLESLAHQGRYPEFYIAAETLRLQADTEEQLAGVHSLAARTRVKELTQLHQFGFDSTRTPAAPANYHRIIDDYRQALRRNLPDPASPAAADVFCDVALAFWALGQPDQAVDSLKKAIGLQDAFDSAFHRLLVRMYLAQRPEDYLSKCADHLELILTDAASVPDDKLWAFVRKADVLIARGHEDQALQLLNTADETLRRSAYGYELEFLRGRALHHAGQVDQADLVLRDLIERLPSRGDIYAQTALELGSVNLQQYRDYDAQYFFEQVVKSQAGKHWYAVGKCGLAECLAMQHRYPEAAELYRQTIELLARNPYNPALTTQRVQMSLAILAHQLSLIKQYDKALMFLEMEQQIARPDDLDAARRFARTHGRFGRQLREQLLAAENQSRQLPLSPEDKLWLTQQRQRVTDHFQQAAQHFLRVTSLALNDDELYGDSIWQAATCYDKAGNTEASVETWRRFVNERQGRPRWPFAMFNLAQVCQAAGDLDAAVEHYEYLCQEHPVSPAALQAMVPLARCYLAQEPPDHEKAERLLKTLLTDPALTPAAQHFREAMFELGQLYYRTGQYIKAIAILDEAAERYPDDTAALGHAMFIIADSYRRTGLELDLDLAALAADPTAMVTREKTFMKRQNYLDQAQRYFQKAIDLYESLPAHSRSDIENMYLRECWLYSADCLFDLHRYNEAVSVYEAAALRYQLSPVALTALMQIVNCYIKLGSFDDARSANQRALWQLGKISDETVAAGASSFSRQQWSDWFNWIEASGLW